MSHWEHGTNLGDAAPVRIFGSLYFVGTQPASTHIIDTEEGLIMLDSGYRQSLPLVLSHMRELGLDIQNLKYIVHTHGHIDHMGGTAELVRMTGAKTFLGKADREYANGTLDLTYSKELGMVWDQPFEPDVLLSDGDEIQLGSTRIRCVATPGHTPGAMTFFFDVTEKGETYTAALHGGMGRNTMCREFLDRYGLSYDCREQFLAAMDRLMEEKVDIFLGNHMQHNDTPQKTDALKNGDRYAFVNPLEWRSRVAGYKASVLEMLKKENND